jgi:hypothetical protein
MRSSALAICIGWIAVALILAARGAVLATRLGRGPAIFARLKSPTVYLFAGYLIVAGLVSPRSQGESSSPLFGLALVLVVAWAAATFAAAGSARRSTATGTALFALYGGAVVAAGAIVLAVASPAFVPPWLR